MTEHDTVPFKSLALGLLAPAIFFVLGSASPALATTTAATPPATLCITAATQELKAGADDLLAKDTAPYAGKAAYAAAVDAYRQELATAWEAMQQPYCGFGSYGVGPAIHSYNKSATRARDAFLVLVKKIGVKPPVAVKQLAVVNPPITAPAVGAATVTSIPKNLIQGMRSNAVTELQKRLAAYFKLKPDADHVTGYFGPLTRQLVVKFQLARHIITSETSPGAGRVGPKTAAVLNGLKKIPWYADTGIRR